MFCVPRALARKAKKFSSSPNNSNHRKLKAISFLLKGSNRRKVKKNSMFIFSNLAISLDGKIGTRKRNLFPLGTAEDRREMNILRLQCDALLMGASTLR